MAVKIKKLVANISQMNDVFSARNLRSKYKTAVLRLLRDAGLITVVSQRGGVFYYRVELPMKSAQENTPLGISKDIFLIDQLFLRMSSWVEGGFSSYKFPRKKVSLMLFSSAHLITTLKSRGRWDVTLSFKGQLLNTGYLALVRNKTSPLVHAFKNAYWYAFEGLDTQQKAICGFYRNVLEVMSSSPDMADSVDSYGVLGGRVSSLINRIASHWQLEEKIILKIFQELSRIPGFIQQEGDRQTMQKNAFMTIYPIELETVSLKKDLNQLMHL